MWKNLGSFLNYECMHAKLLQSCPTLCDPVDPTAIVPCPWFIYIKYVYMCIYIWLPWWFSGKESTYQSKRLLFHPWVKKIPCWRKKRQLTPVFLPRNPMDRGASWATVHGVAKESDTTEQLKSGIRH